MAEFIDIEGIYKLTENDDKKYITTTLEPLLKQNLMKEVREKILEDGMWNVQIFLLTALGEEKYFLNSNKIFDGEFKDYDLISFTIPNTIKKIGNDAFSGTELKSIEIPDSVVEIGKYAFYGPNIETIKIPKRFKNIMKYIFKQSCLYDAKIIYT